MQIGLGISRRVLVAMLIVLLAIAALAVALAFDHQIVRLIAGGGDFIGGH